MQRIAGLFVLLGFTPSFLLAETLLILPFFNLSNSKNIDWIGDSLSETIQESLTREGLLLVPRSHRDRALDELGIRRHARLTRATILEVAVNTDAVFTVSGSFDFTPSPDPASSSLGQIRVQAEVLDARRLHRMPAVEESGPIEDLSRLQTRLAWRLLALLQPQTAREEQRFLDDHPPIRLDALENYVRGLLSSTLDQKLALFANAARLEPAYSQPCFQLGRIHFERKDYRAALEWLKRVLPADSHHRESLFLLGLTRYHLAEYPAARDSFAQIAADAPLGSVLNNLGVVQLRMGDPQAPATLLRAVESDEADPDFLFNLAYAHWRRGELPAAAARFRAVLERTPEDETAALLLARCDQASGPRPGEPRFENLERLRTTLDDTAWRHLKAILGPDSPSAGPPKPR